LHSSLTQWKNLFSFEVFGDEGYATIDGLGGAYGTECLTMGRVEFDKPFQSETTEFRGADISWAAEWMEFRSAVVEKRNPIGDGRDGLQAMRLVLAAYEASNKRSTVKLQ
jgi:predicted dehydrogenase